MRDMCAALKCCLISSMAFAQTPASPVAGTWEGAIAAGAVKLRIGVTITAQPDGSSSATMDSPDQGAYGLSTQRRQVRGRRPHVRASAGERRRSREAEQPPAPRSPAPGRKGRRAAPRPEEGREARAAQPGPRSRSRRSPIASEDVAIANAAGQAVLDGTLTLPEGKGPFPAVVLITGSGPQNRDEELFGPQAVPRAGRLPHAARHRGAAVRRPRLRQVDRRFRDRDERGFRGRCVGRLATLRHATGDRSEAHRACRPQRRGIIAPMLAAAHPEIAFVVMLAGTGVTGEHVIVAQAAAIMKASGAPDDAIAANAAIQRQVFTILREETSTARIVERLECDAWNARKRRQPPLSKQAVSPWSRDFATL